MGYTGPMTRTEAALAYFDEGFDCGKAILRAYEPILSLRNTEREQYKSQLSQLPGKPEEQCEVVTSAMDVLAHLCKQNADCHQRLQARFHERFMSEHDSTSCRKLLGYDLAYVPDMAVAVDSGAVDRVCRDLVARTCCILDELILESE